MTAMTVSRNGSGPEWDCLPKRKTGTVKLWIPVFWLQVPQWQQSRMWWCRGMMEWMIRHLVPGWERWLRSKSSKKKINGKFSGRKSQVTNSMYTYMYMYSYMYMYCTCTCIVHDASVMHPVIIQLPIIMYDAQLGVGILGKNSQNWKLKPTNYNRATIAQSDRWYLGQQHSTLQKYSMHTMHWVQPVYYRVESLLPTRKLNWVKTYHRKSTH